MKWTFEQKLVWVKASLAGEFVPIPKGFSGTLKGWHHRINEWAHAYSECGEEGLNPSGRHRSFPPEFKLAAVTRVLSGESAQAVAYSLGMPNCTRVAGWVRAYREEGAHGLESKQKGRKKHAQEETQIPGAGRIGEAQAGELHAGPRDCLLKKIEGLGGAGGAKPRQKCEAILQTKKEFPEARLSDLLAVAGLPKSTYFYEAKRRDFDAKNADLISEIEKAFTSSRGRYGVRRVAAELRSLGFAVNHKKVQRLMRKAGLSAKRKAVNYNSYRGDVGKVADDLIIVEYVRKDGQVHHKSDFSCTGPNQKWTTDVSQFAFPWGKCYLSPIKDMYDGRIVAYDLSLHADLSQAKRMLEKAFSLGYDLRGLIFHSDQGWQYQHSWYVGQLKERGILQSMSRKGNCLDNCIMESFFGTMKNEMFYGHESEFESFDSFRHAVDEYIAWYNGTRIRYQQGMKKWMSPLACFEASLDGHPCGGSL